MDYLQKILAALLTIVLLPLATTAQQWRVAEKINEHYFDVPGYPYQFVDSTVYTYDYQSSRGSNYNNDTINCDKWDRYVYNTSLKNWEYKSRMAATYNQNSQPVTRTVQYYDGNNWLTQNADTLTYTNGLVVKDRRHREYYKQGTRHYELQNERRYQYDTNRRIVQTGVWYTGLQFGGALTNTERYFNTYHSNGLLLETKSSFLNKNVWVDRMKTSYGYYNQLPTSEDTYYYDSAGNVTSYFIKHMVYDAANRLIIDSVYILGTSPQPNKNLYTYNSQGQLITHRQETPNGSIKITEHRYKYTSFGYVSEVETFVSKDSVFHDLHGYRTRYKYELYWPVNVKETVANNNDLTLYPNPATSVLHINTSETYTQGRIYNSAGQLVKQINANAKQVDISQLPVGNYVLQLEQQGGAVMKKSFVVLR